MGWAPAPLGKRHVPAPAVPPVIVHFDTALLPQGHIVGGIAGNTAPAGLHHIAKGSRPRAPSLVTRLYSSSDAEASNVSLPAKNFFFVTFQRARSLFDESTPE